MNETLRGKGLVKVTEDKVYVTGIKGPLEDGWQEKVDATGPRASTGRYATVLARPDTHRSR